MICCNNGRTIQFGSERYKTKEDVRAAVDAMIVLAGAVE